MHKNFVLTLTGPDRIGIVDRVTSLLLDRGGNVETSRMARLGGEFAMLMLVAMPAERSAGLEQELDRLTAEGYKITTTQVRPVEAGAYAGWIPFEIEVEGADHEGIINQVAHYLSQRGINIESIDSETIPAPITGVPLFTMTALVLVPPRLAAEEWQEGLAKIGSQMNLEIEVSARTVP